MSRRDNYSQVAASVPFDNSTNGFASQDTQAAIEEAKALAQGFPRAAKICTANGTVGNNDWIGPTELLPNTPFMVFPKELQINEITWSNQNTNVEFRVQFRSGSKTGPIFYTLTVTSPNVGYGAVQGLAFTFPAGTSIWAQYLDDGQNMSDAEFAIWVSRIS